MPSSSFSLKKKLPAASSSSSASSSSTSSVQALKQDSGGGGEQSPRRLTRQRKLRHISNQDLGFYFPEKSRSSPTSPEYSTRESSSPGRRSKSNQWSAPQGPQPLPLPESPVIRRPDPVCRDGFFGPRKNTNQVATATSAPPNFHSNNRRGMFSLDVNNGGRFNHTLGLNVSSRTAQSCGVSSHPISPRRSNIVDGLATASAVNCSSNCCRGMPQDVGSDYESANVSKSAPTSVFSSPAVSPRKSSPGEPFPSFWATQDQYPDAFPPRLSPRSPGHSPLHSPTARSPHYQKKSTNGTAFLSHRKSFTESPSDRAESNGHVNAHRLPLPPGAMAQPQPSTMHHQNTEIVPASSMKDQWQKGKLIGRGTFGSVYLATNRETGALCAMKEVELIPDDPKSDECMKQLEQEIKLLSRLKHPNIVQYYGSDKTDEHFYIYLEYVHPGSINKYVQDHIGAMTESVVRNFTRHILSGLAYLHSTKTIHRDIKGANLLVDASGIVKLADFGMAKHLSGQSYNLSMKGSPYWMAPEVIKAVIQNDADPDLALAVDIWSLGCTIIEMFNGKPPWSDFSGPQAMFKVLNTIPDIPEKLSAEGKDFLDWCFRRNPADRPSASHLLDHPFVRNSHETVTKQNVKQPHFKQTISLMNLIDKLHSPRDHNKPK